MKTCNQQERLSVPLITLYAIIFNCVLNRCEQIKIFNEFFVNSKADYFKYLALRLWRKSIEPS